MLFKSTVAAVLLCTGAVVAHSQGLNSTVEVMNDFDATLKDIIKLPLPVSSPDSVAVADMNFTYTVLNRKYGAKHNFSPTKYGMQNASTAERMPWMSVYALAGLPLSSDAGLYLRVPLEGNFSLSAYGTHSGYFGTVAALAQQSGSISSTNAVYKMSDMSNAAGIRGRYVWKRAEVCFDLGYDGLSYGDTTLRRGMNAFVARAAVNSIGSQQGKLLYSAAVGYARSADRWNSGDYERHSLSEDYLSIDASVGGSLKGGNSILVDARFDMLRYSSFINQTDMKVDIVPKYMLSKGRWRVSAGVKFSIVSLLGGAFEDSPANARKPGWIFPEADVTFEAARNLLWIYFKADGENARNRYSQMVGSLRCYCPLAVDGVVSQDYTVNPYRLSLGMRGAAASRFGYDVYAAYGRVRGALGFGDGTPHGASRFSFEQSFDYLSAGVTMEWKSEDVTAHAGLRYNNFFNVRSPQGLYLPSAVTADAEVTYNYMRRLYVSLASRYVSAMKSAQVTVPGWVDLSLELEWSCSSFLSVLLRGGNLLNQTIQHVPGYAAPGINVMGGVSLKF